MSSDIEGWSNGHDSSTEWKIISRYCLYILYNSTKTLFYLLLRMKYGSIFLFTFKIDNAKCVISKLIIWFLERSCLDKLSSSLFIIPSLWRISIFQYNCSAYRIITSIWPANNTASQLNLINDIVTTLSFWIINFQNVFAAKFTKIRPILWEFLGNVVG